MGIEKRVPWGLALDIRTKVFGLFLSEFRYLAIANWLACACWMSEVDIKLRIPDA